MGTCYNGAFVISWSQTELDGMSAAPLDAMAVGVTWSWHGELVRVDGVNGVLRLEQADEKRTRRKCAAKLVQGLISAAQSGAKTLDSIETEKSVPDTGFVVTDGLKTYSVSLIPVGNGTLPLLMFVDDIPPKGVDLWVVHLSLDPQVQNMVRPDGGGVICFTPGTTIQTPHGPRLVEDLREGDVVQTKDNGAEEIQWIGRRKMTGARLFAMPHLRPIRFRPGCLGIDQPDRDLLVSPEHRMLVKGAVARSLFNTDEVLVAAKDLVNRDRIAVDTHLQQVTYIHLLLPRHQILWANGVETESFHPASAALTTLGEEDRARLLALDPTLETEPQAYGEFARRNLSRSEAAILMHEAA